MEMDASGNMVRADFTPGVIRSAERMTYTNVNKVIEGDPEADSALRSRSWTDFRRMKELALLLNKRRASAEVRSISIFPSRSSNLTSKDGCQHRPQRAEYRASPDRGIHARGQ